MKNKNMLVCAWALMFAMGLTEARTLMSHDSMLQVYGGEKCKCGPATKDCPGDACPNDINGTSGAACWGVQRCDDDENTYTICTDNPGPGCTDGVLGACHRSNCIYTITPIAGSNCGTTSEGFPIVCTNCSLIDTSAAGWCPSPYGDCK